MKWLLNALHGALVATCFPFGTTVRFTDSAAFVFQQAHQLRQTSYGFQVLAFRSHSFWTQL